MAALGRAALLLSFALVAYALAGGSFAAWKRRRRLALSAQNALVASFATTFVAAIVLFVALVPWSSLRTKRMPPAWASPATCPTTVPTRRTSSPVCCPSVLGPI